MEIKIKKLSETAILPTRATDGSVGYDLYVAKDTLIPSHSRTIVPTSLAIELPQGYEAQIRPRSGFSSKGMLGLSSLADSIFKHFNADVLLGTVDGDYRGEIGVIVKSDEDCDIWIAKGLRIAQMVINKVELQEFEVVNELSDTSRGIGGFGSTN